MWKGYKGEFMEFNYNQQPGLKLKKEFNKVEPKLALVTIVTPYYNAGKYFEQTFNSVMNQTFPWFEWIIVDDGSTNKEDIGLLHKFAEKDKRIKVVTQANGGLSCARNTGFKNAKTDMVIPLDADDLISPQYIEYVYFGLYFNPNAAWSYTWTVGFHAQEYLWKKTWDAEKLKTDNFLVATAAIKKQAWKDIGGYKIEKWSYNEDWRFWLEMLANHKEPVQCGDYLFWYRRTNNGMLSNIIKNPEQTAFAENIIKEAAKNIDETIKATEYPLNKTNKPYYKPRKLEWGKEYKIEKESSKVRIAMLIPWMTLGGADKFNLDLLAGLDKTKFELGIITTVSNQNDWQQRFEKYTDEIFNLPNFLDPAHYAEFVGYYIESRQVDVLFVSNSCKGYYMLPWLRKQFPMLTIIDYVHMEEWYWKAGGHARTSGMMGAFLDKTYVCNSATREVMIHDFGRTEDSVKTLYIGVDENEFDRSEVKKGYLHNKLGISYDRPIILLPCRIHPQKRPFMIIDIAKCVREQNTKALFVVAGDGEQLEELKSQIVVQGLDNTVFCIGRTDHMKECYADAHITLICSLKEGLSLTAYESCAMGVPVVSSDVGGQRDLIDDSVGKLIPMRQEEDGDFDKRVFDREEIKLYTDAILELLSNQKLYDLCSKNCRKKIERDFSIAKMIDNMENEIDNLVNNEQLSSRHIQLSLQMKEMGNFAEEFFTIENALEEREAECEMIWQSRCFFENNYINETNEKNNLLSEKERLVYEKTALVAQKEELEQELTDFKSMKLYGLIRFYCYFVGENKVGKCIYGVLRKLFGKTETESARTGRAK